MSGFLPTVLLLLQATAAPPAQDPWQAPPEWAAPIELGLLLDLFLAVTEKDDSDEAFNELRIRSARLHARAPVDETTLGWLTLDWGDSGGGAELRLSEAALRLERLPLPGWPQRFHLLVGQYYADLGPWNTVLPGEFAAPQLDGFRRIYLGGNLVARGVEAHHAVALRDLRLRWSLGLATETGGHDADPDEFGQPAASTAAPFGRAGPRNWAATGRVEAVRHLGDERSARVGASLLHSPGELRHTTLPGGAVARDEAERTIAGLDFGYRWEVGLERAHELSLELWFDENHYRVAAASPLMQEREQGQSLLYTYQHDAAWSFGALLSRFDQPSPGEDLEGHHHAIWSSLRLSARNRLTLFFSHTNPAPYEQKWYAVGAQWTIALGASRTMARRRWN